MRVFYTVKKENHMGMKMADGDAKKPLTLQEQLSSYYKPPYTKPQEEMAPSHGDHQLKSQVQQHTEQKEVQPVSTWPIFCLLLGGQLFVMVCLIIAFSTDGVLRCVWTSKMGWFMAALSFPLLFIGYKGFTLIDSDSP
jgi:hypothetical protein